MSTQLYDSNGNPIFSSSAIGSPDQQVSDSTGNIINPAKEDGNLLAIKTDTDKFTFSGSNLLVSVANATLAVTQSGTWNINNISGTISLPTGASTEATLAAVKAQTDKLTFTATRLLVDGSGVTQPISAVSLPLPTGAATEATLGTLLLNSTFTGRINTLGQKTMANSTPIVIASDQTAVPASQSGIWSVRIQDGAGTALTSSLVNTRQALDIHQADTTFVVSGLTAVGNPPSLNPVSIAGVDGGGLKRAFLTDTGGATAVVGRYANGAVGTPAPLVIGGLDDAGAVQIIATDDLVGLKQFLYTVNVPFESDSVKDNTFYSTVVEFSLPSNGTETPFLLLKNPTGNTLKIWIDDMQMDVITKGQQATCRLYHTPTITANGSAAVITNQHVGGGAPASTMQAFSGPTISANGTKMRVFSVGTNSNSTVVPLNYGLLLEPNTSILITGTPTANAVTVAFSIRWTEDL